MSSRHVGFGVLFGFLLVRLGAAEPEAISGMFRLTDLHLIGVIGLAIALNALGFALLRRRKARALSGAPLALAVKPMVRGMLLGATLFGVGWALSGSCPGTTLAQVGTGQLGALLVFVGILGGAWLEQARARRAAAVARARVEPTPRALEPQDGVLSGAAPRCTIAP